MNTKLTQEQEEQLSEILETLGKTLDISETQYKAAVSSYGAVGDWLSGEDSVLARYKPEIKPQGSFMLGTMIKPVHEKDDLDIDLVCQLTGKRPEWTQSHLKAIVGDRIKAHATYKGMLQMPDGRRCWTLKYSDSANYHMDILPSIITEGYTILLEKSFSATEKLDYDRLALSITDKQMYNYLSATDPAEWLKSNPFGYGQWFFQRAEINLHKSFSMNEAVSPVPKFENKKLPLQRVVQILKRHRDMMFDGNPDKPISIIITTLAAQAYQREVNIITALTNIVDTMTSFIGERYDPARGRVIKWVANPVNPVENFADKWPDNPKREENFYKWVAQVRTDIAAALKTVGKETFYLKESLEKPFGSKEVTKAFSDYAVNLRQAREKGQLFTTPATGTFGLAGTQIKNHDFHGTGK